MKISAGLPAGVAALLFEAAAARRAIEARVVPSLEAAGFSEALLPILDYAEPYEPLLAPRRRAELYRFVDRGGELLALRADFTPMLARLLAPRLAAEHGFALPLRLFYRGDVVRYGEERPGRMREFYQLGAEWIGEDGDEAEGAMLETFMELLRVTGCGPLRVVLGFAGALDELLCAGGADPVALAGGIERRERATARAAGGALLEIVERGLPSESSALGSAAVRLDRTSVLAQRMRERFPGIAIDVDLAEFATYIVTPSSGGAVPANDGAYYDGLVFRAYLGSDTQPVAAGGRYDGLFRRLGAPVAAVGFSIGLDRLQAPATGRGANS